MGTFVGWQRSGSLWVRAADTSLYAHSSGRYFVAAGVPTFIFGQAAWQITQNLDQADTIEFLDDQQARGVNCLIVGPIDKFWSFNSPNNLANDAPFTGTVAGGQENLSTPNEVFWASIDWFLGECQSRGIVVILFPTYLGLNDSQGWYAEVIANSQAQIESYASFLGNRYKNYPNIMWVVAGDRIWSSMSATARTRMEQFAAALQTADPNHIVTSHFWPNDLNWEHTSGQWLDWTFVYSQTAALAQNTIDSYAYAGPIPVVMAESTYVDSPNDGAIPTRKRLRTVYWQAILCGSIGGFVFGDENIYTFGGPNSGVAPATPDWRAALDSDFMHDAMRVRDFLVARQWWLLEPDTGSALVTAGRGSVGSSYVAAAKASDGSWAAAYIPGGGQITVQCNQLAGPVTATWFDPSNGATSSAGTGLTGSQNFDPPLNAAGDTDYVLLLVAA